MGSFSEAALIAVIIDIYIEPGKSPEDCFNNRARKIFAGTNILSPSHDVCEFWFDAPAAGPSERAPVAIKVDRLRDRWSQQEIKCRRYRLSGGRSEIEPSTFGTARWLRRGIDYWVPRGNCEKVPRENTESNML